MAGAYPFGLPGIAVPFTFAIDMARTEIKMMARDVDFPALTTPEVELLIRKSKRQDENRNFADSWERWLPSTAFNVGDVVVADPRNFAYFKCTIAGTSDTTQPTWPLLVGVTGATIVDGGITWTLSGAAPWTPTWNLAYGIAQGWKMKMGKAVGAYDIQAGQQILKRSQFFANLKDMQKQWARRASTWDQIALRGSLRDRRLFQNITNQNDELFVDGSVNWALMDNYAELHGFTGVSMGSQYIDP